jgi:uncharacterized protein (TIGR01319 family)
MNQAILLIDFGSTYTKLTLVDLKQETILATSKAITTVQDNIMIGFNEAYKLLSQKVDLSQYEIIKRLACSSASGGLKMVTLGLVPELTVEAAKRAALGAGARVLKTYSYEITDLEIDQMKELQVDIILLSGGTDGGNQKTIIHNAKKISQFKNIPIVVSGNKCAYDEIKRIFDESGVNYVLTENVMPQLNEINVLPVREQIRGIFMKNIIQAKGLEEVIDTIDGILMPTPAAVLTASEVLAKGTDKQKGIGDLIVIDIGGATTDVHSLADGFPTTSGVNLRGLREPYSKRTVEGDLGMRYSALSLLEASGSLMISTYLKNDSIDIVKECKKRHDDIEMVPTSNDEVAFDEALAKVATKLAMDRHVGQIEIVYTPLGEGYNQYGKDLLDVKTIIGTGGVLVHSQHPHAILQEAMFNQTEPTSLKPKHPRIVIDQYYILSAMGLLATKMPEVALSIMKKLIIEGEES